MLNNGVPAIVVSRRLGHSRVSITLDVYGHLIPSMQSEAAELIDELVTPLELHTIAHESHQDCSIAMNNEDTFIPNDKINEKTA